MTSQSTLHIYVYQELMQCKSVCGIKCGIDPLTPSDSVVNKGCLVFRQFNLKAIKLQDFLEEEKMAAMHFEQVQRFINFLLKIFWV